MAVRIPGAAEPAFFSQPTAADRRIGAPNDLPAETADAMARMQARDDAVFVATSLTDLTARQRHAAIEGRDAAMEAVGDPVALAQRIDGFTGRLDDAFNADLHRLIEENRSRSGPRPSDSALELLHRRAQNVRRHAIGRNAVIEDRLRLRGQLAVIEAGVENLVETVRAEPEGFDELLARVSDLTAASAALLGSDEAATFGRDARARVADAAARGLISADADTAFESLKAGLFDDDLSEPVRSRLIRDAESLSLARARDRELERHQVAIAESRQREARAFAFVSDFRNRMRADQASFSDIVAAQSEGWIGDALADALSGELERSRAIRDAQSDRVAVVGRILLDGGRLDPDNPDDREAADLHYSMTVRPTLAELPPGQRIDPIRDYVQLTGLVPQAALRSLAGTLIAGEPADRVKSAKAMSDLLETDPSAGGSLPRGVVEHAHRLAALADLEIPAEKAVEAADGPSTKGPQLAFGPAAAVLPALAGSVDAAALGQAIMGGLAAAGILSLSGDTQQESDDEDPGGEDGDDSTDGSAAEGISGESGRTAPQIPAEPEPPDVPAPPKPGGRGKKARDSAKSERHGDGGAALRKSERQLDTLRENLGRATSRKERVRIRRKMRNIEMDAREKRKGETHHMRKNPAKGNRR